MRSFAYIGIFAFLMFFAVGYSYFYPSHSPLATQAWFADSVVPFLDAWLVNGRQGRYSGHLLKSDGDLKFKSDSDFVFYPARGSQRFYGRTMIASGIKSSAIIEVAEGVQIQLEANTVLVIEPQLDGVSDGPLIRVIGGAVVAKATTSATKKVKVVANGMSRVIDQRGVAVVADGAGYLGEVPQDMHELRETVVSQEQRLVQAEVQTKLPEIIETPDFVMNKVEAPVRAPSSARMEQTQTVAVPQQITRRKFNSELASKPKAEPRTEVAKGLYFAKRGQNSAATRSFASALSSPLYATAGSFGPSVQVALDGMLQSYEMNGRCALARDTLVNATKQYGATPDAKVWSARWATRLDTGRCKNLR